ncbi:MAG: ABC transporter permease [Phototrophicaceae bacterium]
MAKLLAITLHDLRNLFRGRGIWINLVLVPIGLTAFLGFATGGFGGESTPETKTLIDVIDLDQTPFSADLVATLAQDEQLQMCVASSDVAECRLSEGELSEALSAERVSSGTVQALLLIPKGSEEQINQGQTVQLIYRSEESTTNFPPTLTAIENAVSQISGAWVAREVGMQVATQLGDYPYNGQNLTLLRFSSAEDEAQFQQDVYERARTAWAEKRISIVQEPATLTQTSNQEEDASSGFYQSVPGTATMQVMFIVFGGMVTLLEERKNWTLQRMVVLPLAKWQILGGKMLVYFLLGMMVYGVVFAFGAFMGVRYANPLALLMVMAGFSATITSITFFMATIVRTLGQAGGISLFMSLTLSPLGGAWWPLDIVPPWMQTLGLATPVGWAMRGFTDILWYQQGFQAALLPTGILLGFSIVFFTLAVARFRYD